VAKETSLSYSCALLAFSGLAPIVVKEARAHEIKKTKILKLPHHDLILCSVKVSQLPKLATMKSVEDVFYLLGPAPRLEHQLWRDQIDALVDQSSILQGLQLKNQVFADPKPRTPTYNCFVKHDRDRFIHRHQIADQVKTQIKIHFRKWRLADPASVELWGFYIDHQLYLGLRLSTHALRYRGKEPALRPGTLRPTIAGAMLCAANPQANDLVIDPMCGSGTILREGWARQPQASYRGGDNDTTAVEWAQAQVAQANITIEHWDARHLPITERTADLLISNLPFGKRYSTPKENQLLYQELLTHWHIILKPEGRMILLTADSAALEKGLLLTGLGWRTITRVKVLGLWAYIYEVWNS
jgi:tRNA G10  N-methylase Trm11